MRKTALKRPCVAPPPRRTHNLRMSFSVAPGFLIAMPSLLDPNFFRSVVVLASHTDEGAFGLVINQPLDLPVAAICSEASIDWTGDHEAKVFNGGPVEKQRGWVLHDAEEVYTGTQLVGSGVGISTSQDVLEAYGQDPEGRFRLLLGYAGWGPAQLDQEIAMGAWLTAPIQSQLVFHEDPSAVWRLALQSVGVDAANLVEAGTQLN